MTDVTINTGTTLGISATLPSTFDNNVTTGYNSLTFIDVGEVIDIGELAKVWTAINHQSVTRNYPQKLKDTFDIGNVALTIGKVTANTGQAAIKTALDSPASVAFQITLPSGDVGHFTGKVLKAGQGSIASGSATSMMVDIAVDPESLYEA